MAGFLFFIASLLFFTGCTEALVCMSCHGVSDLSLCDQIAECSKDACYVERVDGIQGSRYFAGCKASTECNHAQCSSGQFSCLTCCQGDICNKQGCGSTFEDPSIGLQCFNCDDIGSHERCYRFTTCAVGRECMMGLQVSLSYSLRCTTGLEHTFCPRFGPGSPSQCCNTSLCNVSPNMGLNMTSRTVRTLQCTGHSGGSHVTTPPPPCRDSDTNCATLDSKFGVCQTDRAASLCAKTCNKCHVVTTPGCADKEQNCAALDKTYGVCQVPSKAVNTCAKTCNLCGTGSHVTTPPPPCRDSDTNCATLDSKFGVCQTDRAASLCAKTCNKCHVATTPGCADKEQNCAALDQTYGVCQVPSKAVNTCAKTCNLCGTGAGSVVG